MSVRCPSCGQKINDGGYRMLKHFIPVLGHPEGGLRSTERYKTELARLREVCGEAYQMAGQVGAAERILDNLSDAASGRLLRHETFFPVTDDDFSKLAALKEQLVISEKTSGFHAEHADDLCERLNTAEDRNEVLEKWGREMAVPGLQNAYEYMDHQTSGGLNAAKLVLKATGQARTLGLVEEKP